MRWAPLLLLAALAMAANMTVITTPSGNIHITYIDNGTQIIVNINNYRVITANIKANVTIAGEQYYLHIVGQAKGQFTNATISQLLALLNQTRQGKIDSLIQVFKLLVDSNQTEKLKAKAMLTAASLNKTAPNATYLKMRLEYELEKKLSKFNKTLTKEDEWEIKLMTKDLNKTATLLSAIAARLEKYNISDAKTLLYIAQRLKELSTSVKKLEMYINGTKVEIKFDKNYYKIEIEKGNGKHKSDNKSRDKDVEAKDEKKSNKNDNSDEKDEKSSEKDKKNEKERDDEKSRKEESNKKKGK